jgi:NAD-dependent DNA ligase
MTDEQFEELGNNILKWKHEYYKLGKPTLSDEAYDYEEWKYCKEATARGIQKNKLGEMIDGKFYTVIGYIEDGQDGQ